MTRYYLKVVATPTAENPREATVWYYGYRRHFSDVKPDKGWLKYYGYPTLHGVKRAVCKHQSNAMWVVSVTIESEEI